MITLTSLTDVYAALRQGEWTTARAQCETLLLETPGCARAHHALGLSFCGEANYDLAQPHLERACRFEPANITWANDLAIVYAKLNRWAEARRVLEPVLADIDTPGRILYLSAAIEAGDAATAIPRVDALRLPGLDDDPLQQCEYARLLIAASQWTRAEAILLRCVEHHPGMARAHELLALTLDELHQPDRALAASTAFARLRPDDACAQLRLAMACSARGLVDAARASRLRAMRLGLSALEQRSSALYRMLFDRHESGAGVRTASEAAFAPVTVPVRSRIVAQSRPSRSRLRIGYLTGEFKATPSFYFLPSFLTQHTSADVEVFLYHNSRTHDTCTAAYQRGAEHWRDVARLSDDEVLRAIDDDGCDVLVDLSGHFPENRLGVFARRAAPVQVSSANYPSTTGCPEMDYLLTDIWTSPPGSEDDYSERLWRLEGGHVTYAPPSDIPESSSLPCLRNGFVTLGMFQSLSKITPDVWDAIAGVLRGLPGSRLLLHNADAELDRPQSVTARFLNEQLQMRGIPPGRMTLVGRLAHAAHMALVGQVDIALDTWPFSGHTTTWESLWMGVPVVTLAGTTHASRVSRGLLMRAALGDWVANSIEAYAEIAVRLGTDADALARTRATLRDRVVGARMTDGRRLARAMEQAFCDMRTGAHASSARSAS